MKLVWTKLRNNCLLIRRSPLLWMLIVVLLVGLALRVWGISFGLPELFHNDEGFEVNRALQLASGSFDFSRIGKGGYFYLLFVDFGFLFVFLKLVGVIDTTKDFALLFIRDPSYFYLLGRFTTAVIGTLCLFLVYKIGSRIYSKLVGVIAAVLLCVNVLHVKLSHFITVDIPLTCLCLASFLYFFKILDSNKISNYLWAASFVAMASMTKMPGVILILPFFVAHMSRQKSESRNLLVAMFDRKWMLGCLVLVLLYVIGNPGIVVYFKTVVTGVFALYNPSSTELNGIESGAPEVTVFNPFWYYIQALVSSMGLIVLVLSFLGVLLALFYKPKMQSILLILFGVAFFLALALSADPTLVYVRYVLPLTPILAIFAARFVVLLVETVATRAPLNKSVFSFVFAALLSITAVRGVIADNIQLTKEDSRSVSRNWIEANLPENAKILIEGYTARSERATTPILNSEENIQRAIEYFEETDQPGKAKYFQLELEANVGRKRYDLEFYSESNLAKLNQYINDGVEYIVIRPDYLKVSPKYKDIGPAFLQSIKNNADVKLLMTFEGAPATGSAVGEEDPTIEIYQVTPSIQ